MAKTESTAVNELIDLVKNKTTPLVIEPGADLFGGAAAQSANASGQKRPSRPASPTLRVSTPIAPRAPQLTPRAPSPTASSAGLTVPSTFSASSAGLTVPSPSQRPSVPPPPPRSASSAGLAVPSTFSTSSAGLTVPRASTNSLEPLPRSRAPQSTAEQPIPRATTADPRPQSEQSIPSLQAFAEPQRVRMGTATSPRGTTIPPLSRPAGGTLPPPNSPVAAPFESRAQLSSPGLPVPQQQDLLFDAGATWVAPGARTREDNIALAKKLIIPAIAVIAAGIGFGFYISGKSKTKTSTPSTQTIAPTPTAAPTPSAPPTETVLHPTRRSLESANAATASAGGIEPQPPTKEEQAAQMAAAAAEANGSLTTDAPADALAKVQSKGTVSLTDVRIDTDPQGASITLVDRGSKFPLGSTPLSTSLDPSREYDVIVELAGRPSQTVHLAPSQITRLDISLGGKKPRAAAPVGAPTTPATPAAQEPAAEPATGELQSKIDEVADAKPEAAKPVVKKAETKKAAKTAEPAATEAAEPKAESAAAAATGNGTLMVSSKPPCEILIDGAPTGLTTPQKAIELPAGKHKITFVNAEAGINKTFSVTVKADQPTKLIQDLTAK